MLVLNERTRNRIVWNITKDYNKSFDIIKNNVKVNKDEKFYLDKAFNIMSMNGGKYNFEIDSIFKTLVTERLNYGYISSYILPRVHGTLHLLLNKETNQQLEYFLSNWNKYFRLMIKGPFLVLKLLMLFIVFIFLIPIIKKIILVYRSYVEYLY